MSSSGLFKMSVKLARRAIPFKPDCLCSPPTRFSNGILKDCFQVHSTEREQRFILRKALFYGPLMCRNCTFIQTGEMQIFQSLSWNIRRTQGFQYNNFPCFLQKVNRGKRNPGKLLLHLLLSTLEAEIPLDLHKQEGPCRSLHIPETRQVPLSFLQG